MKSYETSAAKLTTAEFCIAVGRNGLNAGLQHLTQEHRGRFGIHPDVLQVQPPGFHPIEIITSYRAWQKQGREAECPFGRDETMGLESPSNVVAGFEGSDDSGFALSCPSTRQQSAKRTARSMLKDNFSPESTAKKCVGALELADAGDRVYEKIAPIIRQDFFESLSIPPGDHEKLHNTARRRLAGAALSVTLHINGAAGAINKVLNLRDAIVGGGMQGFVDASLEIDELFTPADMLVLYATTGAIASAGHWVVNYASAHKGKNLDFDAVALEALRFGGLNTSLPPRSRSENGRHVIVCISPAMVLRDESIVGEDPYSFDPERYTDEKYGFKRKTVTRTMAFGPGVQRCPSAPAIVPFLRSLAEQIQDSEICTTPADASKPSKKDLNAFRPNRKSDCTIV